MPSNPSFARSSASTNASTARTGLLSSIHSSRHSGNKVDCPRSAPTRKRFIRSSRNSCGNFTVRINLAKPFLRSQGQLGFFDADKRLATLSAKGDPLEAIDGLVPWESFRSNIEAVVLTPDETADEQVRVAWC